MSSRCDYFSDGLHVPIGKFVFGNWVTGPKPHIKVPILLESAKEMLYSGGLILTENISTPEFMPQYADDGSSGADLFACISENIEIGPLQRVCIPTGVNVAILDDYEIQIRPRSGLALKNGITVLNTPGTIDSSYRGEIKVILINLSDTTFTVEPKMKIAQAVCTPVVKMDFIINSQVEFKKHSTSRGSGGFGSTGL